MIAYIRFDELENKSKIVEQISNVLVRVENVRTFDGEPYEVYQVDCINVDGTITSFNNVLDVMIE